MFSDDVSSNLQQQQNMLVSVPELSSLPEEHQSPRIVDDIYAQFRDQSRFWIQRVAVPIILVVGLFGNLVTIIIMTRRRMRSTTNMYLAALAFVDIMYLVLTFVLSLTHYPNFSELKYYPYWLIRPYIMMLTDACSNTSVWLTVTFTLERCFAVKFPMKGKIWCTERKAKIFIICVFLMGITFASPVPFEWEVVVVRTPIDWVPPATPPPLPPTTQPTSSTIGSSMIPDLHSSDDNRDDDQHQLQHLHQDPIPNRTSPSLFRERLTLNETQFGHNETYKNIYYKTTAILFTVIPLLLLVVANGFLIKSVHESRRERQRMTNASGGSTKSSINIKQQQKQRANVKIDVGTDSNHKQQKKTSNLSRDSLHRHNVTSKEQTTTTTSSSMTAVSHSGDTRVTGSDKQNLLPDRNSTDQNANRSSDTSSTSITTTATVLPNQVKCLSDGHANGGGQSGDGMLLQYNESTKHSPIIILKCDNNNIDDTQLSSTFSSSNDKTQQPKQQQMDRYVPTMKNLQFNQQISDNIRKLDGQSQQIAKFGDQETNLIRISANFQQQHQIASVLQRGPSIIKNPNDRHHNHASSQERRITIMLIAVVILFLVCQTPTAVLLFYESNRDIPDDTGEQALILGLGNIFNFLMAFNAAGNFILYSFLSKKYRKTFVLLFCNCFKPAYSKPKKLINTTTEVNHSLTSTAV